jgi:hypothetical protein
MPCDVRRSTCDVQLEPYIAKVFISDLVALAIKYALVF